MDLRLTTCALGAILLLGILPGEAASTGAAYTALAEVEGAGSIRGEVRFGGPVPEARVWEVEKDREVCGARKRAAPVRGSGGGLADAVVAIRDIAEGKAPGSGPVLSHQQCEFVPRVMAMTAGQRLTLVNRDPLPTRITGEDTSGAAIFRFLQPVQGAKHKKLIAETGLIRIRGEDDRPWARALVYVAAHPYVTVTDEDGSFVLTDVPPGAWELLIWHETLGSTVAKVEVPAGGQARAEVSLGPEAR